MPTTLRSTPKKILLTLLIISALLITGVAASAYWAYRQQNTLLVNSANRMLAPYGIEVLTIEGLQTGLRQSTADSVEFLIDGQPAIQRLRNVALDYELQTLVLGEFSLLSAQSAVIQLQHAALPDDATVIIADISARCQSLSRCTGNATISAEAAQLSTMSPAILLTGSSAAGNISFDYAAPTLQLNIEPGLTLALGQANLVDGDSTAWLAEDLSLTSNQTWRLNLDLNEQVIVFDGGQMRLVVPSLRNQPDTENAGLTGFELDIDRMNGSYDLSQTSSPIPLMNRLTASMGLEISRLYTTLQPFNVWPYQWPTSISWDSAQNLNMVIDAVTQGRTIATLQVAQNLADGAGTLTFNTETLAFTSAEDSLSRLISPLPLEADLISGELDIAAKVDWVVPDTNNAAFNQLTTWRPSGNVTINATELTGVIDETIFSGLTTAAEWELQADLSLVSRGKNSLRIQKIDPGLPLENIQTDFSLDTGSGQLAISSLNFTLFGGAVDSDPFVINLSAETAGASFGDLFDIRISGLDINQLLSLSAYNGVSATGLVDGILPVRLQGIKPVIVDGKLDARAPGGSIRYTSGDSASGNQSLDLVYQALQHYRYDSLSAQVDYNETGELILETQLQGVSPELNNGQRINLNLNISDNIPALLQSLQAAESITERLEQQLE